MFTLGAFCQPREFLASRGALFHLPCETEGQYSQENLRVPGDGNLAMNLRTKIPSSPKAMSVFRYWGGVVKPSRSWFALATFCATTALVLALAVAIFFAGATVALAFAHTVSPLGNDGAKAGSAAVDGPSDQASPASDQTFTGLVTDDRCGARHDMGSDKSPAECAKVCVHNGAKYALVDGEKTYTLQGNAEEIALAAGRRVTLRGALEGDTIYVRSIASNQ